MRRGAAIGLAVLTIVLAAAAATGTAQSAAPDAELEARTRELSAELRCPVCQGISIQDSPAELAVDMRAIVREQLQAGRTPKQVKAYFVGRYGEWILLRPEAEGFNLVVYVLPFVALAAGGAALFVLVRRWRRTSPAHAATRGTPPD